MSNLGNRVSKLEARSKPNGGVVVTSYLDSRDDERLIAARRQADEQGALLIVIKKFFDPVTGAFNDGEVPGVVAR